MSKDIVSWLRQYIKEIGDQEPKKHTSLGRVSEWVPPEMRVVKVNFDATFRLEDNISCSGIVAQNSLGQILASQSQLHSTIGSPFSTEAMACLQAI